MSEQTVELCIMESGSMYLNDYRVYGSVKNGTIKKRLKLRVKDIKDSLGFNKDLPIFEPLIDWENRTGETYHYDRPVWVKHNDSDKFLLMEYGDCVEETKNGVNFKEVIIASDRYGKPI